MIKRFSLGQAWVDRATKAGQPDSPSVVGSDAGPLPLSQDIWLERYANRFVEVAALSIEQAHACSRAESFAVLSEDYEDDPEGAADMEMSYWDWEEAE